MAKLITDLEHLKAHITVSASLDFKKILPYAKRAERKLIVSVIGRECFEEICEDQSDSGVVYEVRFLLQEAVANYAVYLAVPYLNVLISNSGLKKSENTKSESADWKDIKDMKRDLLETSSEALDAAIELMEENEGLFESWTESKYYTVFKSFIVNKTQTFNEFFDIKNNRRTFLALKPIMSEVEQQYLLPMLGKCTLDFVKTKSENETVVDVQELLKRAVVALTVAKVAVTGRFLLTATSLMVIVEELPWERSKLELSPDNQNKLRSDRQNAGEEYLKLAKGIIKDNPSVFDCYEDRANEGLEKRIVVKKSHISL